MGIGAPEVWAAVGTIRPNESLLSLVVDYIDRMKHAILMRLAEEPKFGSAVNRVGSLHPGLVLWLKHTLTGTHLEPSVVEALGEVIDSVVQPPTVGTFPGAADILSECNRELSSSSGKVASARVCSLSKREMSYYERALSAVCEDALFGAETQHVLRYIVPVEGPGLRNASHPSGFGSIFVNVGDHRTAEDVMYSIVHEVGHHVLLAVMAYDPLIKNGAFETASPLRSDLRPLRGVLHATYVLLRMVDASETLPATRNPSEWLDQAATGLETLAAHADWTEIGRGLENAMRHSHARASVQLRSNEPSL